jgi:hypothetical protein
MERTTAHADDRNQLWCQVQLQLQQEMKHLERHCCLEGAAVLVAAGRYSLS